MNRELIDDQECSQAQQEIASLCDHIGQVIYGQSELIEYLVLGILAGGHVLLEGLPGLGKTELVKCLAQAIQLEVKRIQFTPDLLPGDITGSPILQDENGRKEFLFQPGPVFANFVLADEINRASPKTQSALLEAMQEKRVTVLGVSHALPEPFFVLATQNPIELEGTYPLPEAQLDRFLFKLNVPSPDVATLMTIVQKRELGEVIELPCLLSGGRLKELQELARRIFMPDPVANYIARIVAATHTPESDGKQKGLKFGSSPRGAIALSIAAKALALKSGRKHASYEDVRAVAIPALQHRIILDYSARRRGASPANIIQQILSEVPALEKDLPGTVHVV